VVAVAVQKVQAVVLVAAVADTWQQPKWNWPGVFQFLSLLVVAALVMLMVARPLLVDMLQLTVAHTMVVVGQAGAVVMALTAVLRPMAAAVAVVPVAEAARVATAAPMVVAAEALTEHDMTSTVMVAMVALTAEAAVELVIRHLMVAVLVAAAALTVVLEVPVRRRGRRTQRMEQTPWD